MKHLFDFTVESPTRKPDSHTWNHAAAETNSPEQSVPSKTTTKATTKTPAAETSSSNSETPQPPSTSQETTMTQAPQMCLYCDHTDPNCGFCDMGKPLDTQQDWDATWGLVFAMQPCDCGCHTNTAWHCAPCACLT